MKITAEAENAVKEFLNMNSDADRIAHYGIDTIKNFYYLVNSDSVHSMNYSIEWPKNSDIFIEDFARGAGVYNKIGSWILQVGKINDFAFDVFRSNPEVIDAVTSDDNRNYYRDTIFDTLGHLLTHPRSDDSIDDAIRDFVREHSFEEAFLNYDNFTAVYNEELFGVTNPYEVRLPWKELDKLKQKNNEIRRDVVGKAFHKQLPESAHINILI